MRRTILITGAARRLGAALAIGLAQDGHRIAIHYRSSRNDAEKTLETIRNAGGEAALFQSEMRDLTDGEKLLREATAHFSGLDTLINNAGTFIRKSFDDMTWEDWQTGLSSTVNSAFIATRAALPHLRKSGHGRIINLGDSMSDRTGYADPAMSYYVGKAGIWLMTRTLAAKEASNKITVNMVSPGVLEGSVCPTPVEEMPMGRYGTPEDVLRPIRFLLEEGSEALTGSNLHVGGGWNIAPE